MMGGVDMIGIVDMMGGVGFVADRGGGVEGGRLG